MPRSQRTTSLRIVSDQGRLDEARPLFDEALRVFRASKWMLGVPLVTSNLGRLAAREGRFDEADELLREAIAACVRLGADTWVTEAQGRLAERRVLAGEYREAQTLAAEVATAAGATALGALAERSLGYAHVQAREAAEALPHLERSLEIAEGIGATYEVALTLKALGDAGAPEADAHRARSSALLADLGVLAVPEPPLPLSAAVACERFFGTSPRARLPSTWARTCPLYSVVVVHACRSA